jgi:hypothetical protein
LTTPAQVGFTTVVEGYTQELENGNNWAPAKNEDKTNAKINVHKQAVSDYGKKTSSCLSQIPGYIINK